MKWTFMLLLSVTLLLSPLFAQTPATATLAVNRIKAGFSANGALFTDHQQGQFIAPYTPGAPEISLLRAAGLWIGGVDPAGNLRGAVQLYNTDGKTDFYPGPLDENAQPTNTNLTGIYRVTQSEILAHRADLADNGIVDHPQPGVFGWPARGNPYFEAYHPGQSLPNTSQSLAGFFDSDGDATYDPAHGDYPAIELRGCALDRYPTEMLWFVFHDAGPHTQSGMKPVQMEIQAQIFAYDCTEESALRNTVFVRFKLINRAQKPIDNFYIGLFNNFNIGNPDDDFFGSDPGRSLVFGYNGDGNDENGFGKDIPALGVDIFRGPLNDLGQEIQLTHVMPVDPDALTNPLYYYRLLDGRYIDNTPAPNNGFLYPGNPNDPNANTEIKAGNTPGKRRVLASLGPLSLLPGAVNELIAGYTYAWQSSASPLQNVQAMFAGADAIQGIFGNCFNQKNCTSPSVAAPELPDAVDLRVFPNPASQNLTIERLSGGIQRVRMTDLTGQLVSDQHWKTAQQQAVLPVGHLSPGVYFVEVQLTDARVAWEKVVVASSGRF